jgi:pepF/M3 family oligoendopeptidase
MSSVTELEQPVTEQAPRWDLDAIFPGGSASRQFADFRSQITDDLEAAESEAARLPRVWAAATREAWIAFILKLQDILTRVETAQSFAGCLTAQNVNDDVAHRIGTEIDVLASRWQNLRAELEDFSLQQADANWESLINDARLEEIRFYLDQTRIRARAKMPLPLEKLAQELAVNGYHTWNRLYDKMAGDLTVQFELDGAEQTISLGQLAMYMSNANRDVRRQAFEKLEAAWETRASLAAMALNAQGGFRLSLYKNRKWDSFLYEPLTSGRLKKETLDAMWDAVKAGMPKLKPYIDAKKKMLGIDRFCWFDQTAPMGRADKTFGFNEAGRFIVDQLDDFSADMADFTRKALRERWVEAENRPGKAGGGFCTTLNTHKVTRIFMTWGGEYDHLMTLAHELGHAYHAWVLRDTPFLAADYPMNLAETASTFNELRVTDAALKGTHDPRERLMLLDQKLQNAYVFFCNLRARFLFDCAFYRERKEGAVPRARLDELMVNAQREAFGGTLADPGGFHPLFWASKLHFFITTHPFYNFPYTFGFLFANGVYDRAQKEGASFADSYRNLLADTGKMTTEDVASKHLGADLTRRDFWDDAVNRVLLDVERFTELARSTT